MSLNDAAVLHVLRNPYSWTEEDQRQARLKAADTIESLRAQLAAAEQHIKQLEAILEMDDGDDLD